MKDDRVYLRHILRCIARIEAYTAAGRESFFSSELIQDAVIRNLQTLAESAQAHNKAMHPTARAELQQGLGIRLENLRE